MGVFKSESTKTRTNGGKTIIASGCKIDGELVNLGGSLHVDGLVEGIVETEDDISVGAEGCIRGLVKAKTIVISGLMEGKVACETMEILKDGKLCGELVCGEMLVEAGGKFIGESRELTEGGIVVSFPELEGKELKVKELFDHEKGDDEKDENEPKI